MPPVEKTIYVYENWTASVPALMGKLHVSAMRAQENFSFEYDEEWLSHSDGLCFLDPDLSLYQGRHYAPMDKKMFDLFADSCPDRWGRTLLKRKEEHNAKKEGRKPRRLQESDFLLGVYDEARMGALRFCTEKDGPFLSDDKSLATPPWVMLRTLEHASIAFENDERGLDEQWLKQLLAPGSSLGGARPKATVQAADGALWIAKFPSTHDEYNAGAWEKVVHDLAGRCGLNVPESKLESFSETGSTFLVKRFDREGTRRIHFASAMTLLGKTDGVSAEDGTSYLDMVSFIRGHGAAPETDLLELWKRIVFTMAVSNTDDHLRNHGFILTQSGWRLSPLYDVNPVPFGDNLSLNVSENDSTIDYGLAVEVAPYFGIEEKEAERIVRDISETVQKNWEPLAKEYRLSRGSIEHMRPAFSLTF